MRRILGLLLGLLLACLVWSSVALADGRWDLILENGLIHDGSGLPPVKADLGVEGDRIVAIGNLDSASAERRLDLAGLAVAPGFINVLSWATDTLIEDGRALSDIRQGVSLEIFGEGVSMGPLNADLKQRFRERQGDIRYELSWTTLGDYLEHLEGRGVSPNVASFVGATTLRMHVIGLEDRKPTGEELQRMQDLARQAMAEGALGLGTSLIYAPAFYADTEELVALATAVGESGGSYISHLRSEGNRLLESVDELIEIAERAGVAAEIYHLKAAGESNWPKMQAVFERVEAARERGLRITADMYTYPAGATGLDAAMPPWVQEGGLDAWIERLENPDTRARVIEAMRTPSDEWENLLLAAGSAERVLLNSFKSEALKPLTGQTLAAVAKVRGVSPEEAAIQLVIEDKSRVGAVYFLMSEENIRAQIRKPWVSFGSDAGAPAPEGVFLKSNPHPRAYGNVARLLGRYVREQQVIPLAEAIRRLTSLPAENLGLKERGRLEPGYYADIVVFDPERVHDPATFDSPHQLATGVEHVWINGVQVLAHGRHTGATPGRVVRGPGWKGWKEADDE